jgi:hypothetical protein
MIQERPKSGLERARPEGKTLGRPPIDPEKEEAARVDLLAGRDGIVKLAAAHGVGVGPSTQPASTALRDSLAALGAPRGYPSIRTAAEAVLSHLWVTGGARTKRCYSGSPAWRRAPAIFSR